MQKVKCLIYAALVTSAAVYLMTGSQLKAATVQKSDKKNNRALFLFTEEEIPKIIKDRSIELKNAEGGVIKGVINKIGRKQKLGLIVIDQGVEAPKVKTEWTVVSVGTTPVSSVTGSAESEEAGSISDPESSAGDAMTSSASTSASKGERWSLAVGLGAPVDQLVGFGLSLNKHDAQNMLSYGFKYSYALSSDVKTIPAAETVTVGEGSWNAQLAEIQVRYKFWSHYHFMLAPGYRWLGADLELTSKYLGDQIDLELNTRSWVISAGFGGSWPIKKSMLLTVDIIGYSYPFTKDTGSKLKTSAVFDSSERSKLQRYYDKYADYLGSKSSDRFLELQVGWMF